MPKKKPENYQYVSLPDLKCSFFLVENKKKKEDNLNLLIRLEEGRHKGIIVEVAKFDLGTDKLTFEYEVVYNPYDTIANPNTLELFIKKTVGKIVTNAIKSAIENEKVNANRKSDSEVAFIK